MPSILLRKKRLFFKGQIIASESRSKGYRFLVDEVDPDDFYTLDSLIRDELVGARLWFCLAQYDPIKKESCILGRVMFEKRPYGSDRSFLGSWEWSKRKLEWTYKGSSNLKPYQSHEVVIAEGEETTSAVFYCRDERNLEAPFGNMRLSHQLALTLIAYGPLDPETAARGLGVRVQQVKGSAAALVKAGVLVKGKDPYQPVDAAELKAWLEYRMGFNGVPKWIQSLIDNPQRLANLRPKAGL